MIRLRTSGCALLFVATVSLLAPLRLWAQPVILTPEVNGDQLLFFYDARTNQAPFLVVSNFSVNALTLEIAWYSQDANTRVATQIETLPAAANRIFEPSQVPGVNGNAGLMIVTPVRSTTDLTPVVPPSAGGNAGTAPLFGGYTQADLSTNSAFGQNPLARVAVDASGERAAVGAAVDGTTVRYQRFAPDALILPFYFDPSSAGLANRVILGAFEDRYAGGFSIGPANVTFEYRFVDSVGNLMVDSRVTVSGVFFNDVQSLAGGVTLTSSGKGFFGNDAPLPPNANVFGIVSQSFGPFAVGQQMPGVFTASRLVLDQQNLVNGGDLAGQAIGRFDLFNGDPDPAGTSFDFQDAQTFTVGVAGRLARIRVSILNLSGGSQSVALDVRNAGPEGFPDTDDREVLGTVRVPASALADVDNDNPDTWVSFDVDCLGIDVTAGRTLAFSLRTSETAGYIVNPRRPDTYSGGRTHTRNRAETSEWIGFLEQDYLFQTFVRVP